MNGQNRLWQTNVVVVNEKGIDEEASYPVAAVSKLEATRKLTWMFENMQVSEYRVTGVSSIPLVNTS